MNARWAAGVLCLVVSLAAMAGFAKPSLAFNGQRRGFVLGLGLGPAFRYMSSAYSTSESPVYFDSSISLVRASRRSSGYGPALATDFRIGLGFTNRILIYYDNRVSWSGTGNGLAGDGLSSAAIAYYFKDAHPSVYLTGGVGSAGWARLYYDGRSSRGYTGLGFFGGAGYEMSKRFNLEGSISYAVPSYEYGSTRVTSTIVGFRAHMIVLWY